MNDFTAGSTSLIDLIFIQDSTSTTGGGKTSLAFNTASLTCYYKRTLDTSSTVVSLASITTLGTYISGGFKEIDSTNMPGLYEFHPPNAAFATGGSKEVVFCFQGATGMVPRLVKYRILQGLNNDSMAALPTSTAGSSGGLPTVDSNNNVHGLQTRTVSDSTIIGTSTFASGGNVNATQWNGSNITTTIPNTLNVQLAANQGNPVNFQNGMIINAQSNVAALTILGNALGIGPALYIGSQTSGSDILLSSGSLQSTIWGNATRTLTANTNLYDGGAADANAALLVGFANNISSGTTLVAINAGLISGHAPSAFFTNAGASTVNVTYSQAAAGMGLPSILPGQLSLIQGNLATFNITGLGNISGSQEMWFTVKPTINTQNITDPNAILQIQQSTGLIVLNKTVYTSNSSNGSIVVTNSTTGAITITLHSSASSQLPVGIFDYDIRSRITSVDDQTLAVGQISVYETVTQTL